MGAFLYKARDRQGGLQSGRLDAGDPDEALAVLQQRGLIVLSVAPFEAGATLKPKTIAGHRYHTRVTNDDKILFCQQLAVLLEAGIPLLRSLNVIAAQTESRVLLAAIEQIKRDVEGGWTFRHAMAKHPHVFSRFWINLIETGEASGHLPKSLIQLSRYLESTRELQSKAMTALTYPLILIGAAVVALLIFIFKIIPIFKGIFASMGAELPAITKMVLAMSDFARQYALVVLAVMVAVGYGVRQFVRTEQGRSLFDQLLLEIPLFKMLFVNLQLAQFARGLSTLLESGVPILAALEIMSRSATNVVYARAIAQTQEHVREGGSMAEPLERTALFPPMVVQMIQVGEEIGELGKMLERVAQFYEERVATFLSRLSVTFEPIAIAIMGLVIGGLVIAIFLPIFQMAGGFHVR
jgi:type IV pilus assembly protein PilC